MIPLLGFIIASLLAIANQNNMKTFKQFLSEQNQTQTGSSQAKPTEKKVCDINGICKILKTYESAGNEEKILSPYKDSKGLMTIVHGHLITKESPQIFQNVFAQEHKTDPEFGSKVLGGKQKLTPDQADSLLKRDVEVRIPKVEKLVPNLSSYSSKLQGEIVSEYYRGMMGKSPKAVKMLNAGDLTGAASEFLNAREYRESIRDKTGIAKRMENLSNAMKEEAEAIRIKKEEELRQKSQAKGQMPKTTQG
jgi:GH24 family phage-related lysozyme (muramidase)